MAIRGGAAKRSSCACSAGNEAGAPVQCVLSAAHPHPWKQAMNHSSFALFQCRDSQPRCRIQLISKMKNKLFSRFIALGLTGFGTLTAWAEPEATKSILPVLDLASDSVRQVVLAQGTESVYQGHPTTLLMP